MQAPRSLLGYLLLMILPACGDSETEPGHDHEHDHDAAIIADAGVGSWPFVLPPGFPVPRMPDDMPLTEELAELGRYMFYDVRLSANQKQSCGSCHLQEKAFSDGRVTAVGSTGDVLRRNAMSLTNVAYNPSQTWANPQALTLELQAMVPIFAEHPIELGVSGNEQEILTRFGDDPKIQELFRAAMPEATELGWPEIIRSIAAFERKLISGNSRVDQFRAGDESALTEAEKRGQTVFFSEELECHHCHGGFNFTIATDYAGLSEQKPRFFNTGLYNLADGAYPNIDQGLWEFTFVDADRGRYRPPTLRNIEVTAPYMHDGSVATLEEVVAIYERGGRLVESGANAGDGKTNPHKSPFVGGFTLTNEERSDLVAFLKALTDESFLTDPAIADPFKR